MKIFISWSGTKSKKLGEALRDWIPNVLQRVSPYFTPSDTEKGTSWFTEISNELSNSNIGILCLTRENIHNDWILFEAGALSNKFEKSNVCPILFDIKNTDIDAPLGQFQTTMFDKNDMLKLLGVINAGLGEYKLPQKTLETVFEKWWPDLEDQIQKILGEEEISDAPVRTDRDILDEILTLSRMSNRKLGLPNKIRPEAIAELLENFILLHDQQAAGEGGYQETLDILNKMYKSVNYISSRFRGTSKDIDSLTDTFNNLDFIHKTDDMDNSPPF